MSKNEKLRTITSVFSEARNRPVTQVAFRYSDGLAWHDVSWPEYYTFSEKIAGALSSLGVKRGDRVAIVSNSRYEWAITDLASLGLGCVTVPIYQSNTAEDTEFILNNSEAVAIFVEDLGQLKKIRSVKAPNLKHIISFNPLNESGVYNFSDFLALGGQAVQKNPDFFAKECAATQLSDMATIVYTSGTTGTPKGAVLTHKNIASECEDLKTVLEIDFRDSTLTWLPFAHIFGRVEIWANVYIGWTAAFAESIDRITDNLQEIRPTFMMAVPRIFEKIYSKILGQVDDGSPAKKKIFNWALSVGSKVSRCRRENKSIPFALDLQFKLAYKLVFHKINERLGGRIRYLVSGGAPLAREIAEFFHAAGILILEGYGLTETTAAITVNSPRHYRFGSVGKAIGDVKIKIAEDGEILAKSDKIFSGYFKNEEATSEVFTDGWFHTGDIAELDKAGFVTITDRKKDLIKTAGGKMIAPQKLESSLKTDTFISQAVVFGDRMKYLVALVTLNSDELLRFAKENGISDKNPQLLVQNGKVKDRVHQIIREKNAQFASYETIKNFALLPKDLTVEAGELTPSLKVKRKFLGQKFENVIKDLYQGHG